VATFSSSLLLGHEIDDLHAEVGKRLSERPDPLPRRLSELVVGDLSQDVEMALVRGVLDQALDQELVLFDGHFVLIAVPLPSVSG
jgi:hypothetical protein